jgi:tRNA (mo5U34)-methyltransferase
MQRATMTSTEIAARIRELGAWFHNIDLAGVQTAPNHFLGDYPRIKWQRFAHVIPTDLSGKTVLDVGCNGGFYSIEMKKRGASRVVGIDTDDAYLDQARFAARVNGVELELRNMSVYDVERLGETFDLVIFMGVLYQLRHPLLALHLLRKHVTGDLLLFQSMLRGSAEVRRPCDDEALDETATWVPDRVCAEVMLRSAGFEVLEHPEEQVYLCRTTR